MLALNQKGKVFGFKRPRVSINILTDKTHKEASKVAESEAGSLMRSVDCGCPQGKDHDKQSTLCEIPYWEEIFFHKDPVWRNVRKWCVSRNMTEEETAKV